MKIKQILRENPIILLLIPVAIAFVIIMILFIKDEVGETEYVIFSNIVNYECDNLSCSELSNEEIEKLKLKFNILTLTGEQYNNHSLKFIKIWNIFDDDDNYINYVGDFFAYNSDSKINIVDFKNIQRKINKSEEKYIIKTIGNKKIKKLDDLTINEVYELDLNGNSTVDKFVTVSNMTEDGDSDIIYNVAYIEIDGEKTIITNETYNDKTVINLADYYLEQVYVSNDSVKIAIKRVKYYNPNNSRVDIYAVEDKKLKKLN